MAVAAYCICNRGTWLIFDTVCNYSFVVVYRVAFSALILLFGYRKGL